MIFQSPLKNQIQSLTRSQESHLAARNIRTVENLLWNFPQRYESRVFYDNLKNLFQLLEDQGEATVSLSLLCEEKTSLYVKKFWGGFIPQFIFRDGINPHKVVVTGFNPKHRKFEVGIRYILIGKLKITGSMLDLYLDLKESQELTKEKQINVGKVIPVYRSIKTISGEMLRNFIHHCFHLLEQNDEKISYHPCVPKNIQLVDKLTNLKQIHFPKNEFELEKARKELALEELFIFQTKILQRKKERKIHRVSVYNKDEITQFVKKLLPYPLRDEQIRVFQEIKSDLQRSHTMSRILQGEVGCGKTVICLLTSVLVAENGRQCVIVAPTEILAKQHFEFFKKILDQTSLKVGFFSRFHDISQEIARGEFQIIIATHSALQKAVKYKDLGCVILDEQQRFGVKQREDLLKKGNHVDLLMVSATPIPHSLGLLLYGDLDISEIQSFDTREKKSKVIHHNHRIHAYKFLKQQVQKSEQGFVIFPLIEDAGDDSSISLLKEWKKLCDSPLLKNISVGMVHGKLSNMEKQNIMDEFAAGKIQVLCSTSILEVGIDHHNATVMIIEGAERFGLCQLHQMRGRVGRGEKPGYCYVVTSKSCTTESLHRLKQFCKTQDGFALANLDLSFRGYGDILGTQQSGIAKFQIAKCPGEDLDLALSIKKYLETGTTIPGKECDTFESL